MKSTNVKRWPFLWLIGFVAADKHSCMEELEKWGPKSEYFLGAPSSKDGLLPKCHRYKKVQIALLSGGSEDETRKEWLGLLQESICQLWRGLKKAGVGEIEMSIAQMGDRPGHWYLKTECFKSIMQSMNKALPEVTREISMEFMGKPLVKNTWVLIPGRKVDALSAIGYLVSRHVKFEDLPEKSANGEDAYADRAYRVLLVVTNTVTRHGQATRTYTDSRRLECDDKVEVPSPASTADLIKKAHVFPIVICESSACDSYNENFLTKHLPGQHLLLEHQEADDILPIHPIIDHLKNAACATYEGDLGGVGGNGDKDSLVQPMPLRPGPHPVVEGQNDNQEQDKDSAGSATGSKGDHELLATKRKMRRKRTTKIAGAVAGGVGAALLVGSGIWYMKRRRAKLGVSMGRSQGADVFTAMTDPNRFRQKQQEANRGGRKKRDTYNEWDDY